MTSSLYTLQTLINKTPTHAPGLVVNLDSWSITVQSNSRALLEVLADYFGDLALFSTQAPQDSQTLLALHFDQTYELEALYRLAFKDWQRELGKTGRKEAVHDFQNHLGQPQRLVHKVKTGLVLWQNAQTLAAFGDLNTHPNQVINFILSQNLNHWQNQGWLLGHCAALQLNDQRGIAIAGVSGGGKSTLMLKLLEQAQGFISNDRILMHAQDNRVLMRGIPKQPRINPGTIVHNPKLHRLIENHQPYLSMPENQLRALEEKYDAPIQQLYPAVKRQAIAPLDQLYLLNWQLDSAQTPTLSQVDLNQREDLLQGIIKSPVFFTKKRINPFKKTAKAQTYKTINTYFNTPRSLR